MSDVNRENRPLSPHLQVYRLYRTMVVSGLHRITGFGLAITAVLVVWWFAALAADPGYFVVIDWLLSSWIGKLVMIVSLWGLCHHMLNGIRHLIWDTGRQFDLPQVERGANVVLFGAPVLAVVALVVMILR